MITYTCDICGDSAAASYHVDRYQVQLDLCPEHLQAWVDFAMNKILAYPPVPAMNRDLGRALMDALVNGWIPVKLDPARPFNPDEPRPSAIDSLKALIVDFMTTTKPKT